MFAVAFLVIVILILVVAVTAIAQPPNKWVKWFTEGRDHKE